MLEGVTVNEKRSHMCVIKCLLEGVIVNEKRSHICVIKCLVPKEIIIIFLES